MNRDDLYWPAFLICMSVFLWLWIEDLETERVVEDVSAVLVDGSDAYYPPRKDTSAVARVCCRVSSR